MSQDLQALAAPRPVRAGLAEPLRHAAPWAVLASLFAAVLAVPAVHTAAEPQAWAGLGAVAALALAVGARWAPAGSTTAWLQVAFFAALFAVAFFGANLGGDVLHGIHRRRIEVAEYLGGLELWLVLCPGVTSVALAQAVRAALAPARRTR